MAALKYKVELNESERTHLKQMASRGETSARKVKRALVLLKADEGMTDRDIASGLLISASTVGRVRTRFVKEELDSALNERPRPGQKRKLDGRQEAHLIVSRAERNQAVWRSKSVPLERRCSAKMSTYDGCRREPLVAARLVEPMRQGNRWLSAW